MTRSQEDAALDICLISSIFVRGRKLECINKPNVYKEIIQMEMGQQIYFLHCLLSAKGTR